VGKALCDDCLARISFRTPKVLCQLLASSGRKPEELDHSIPVWDRVTSGTAQLLQAVTLLYLLVLTLGVPVGLK